MQTPREPVVTDQTPKLTISVERCATEHILREAPSISNIPPSLQEDINHYQFIPTAKKPVKHVQESSVMHEMMTDAALLYSVKEDAWKDRDVVNQFYNNALLQYRYLYLLGADNDTFIRKTNEFIVKINNGRIQEVVEELNSALAFLISKVNASTDYETTNPANGFNMGGASTYKAGTVEEALCGKSNLFLELVLKSASGAYQENILRELLTTFLHLQKTGKPLIETREQSDQNAEKWVKKIYKPVTDGYFLATNETHQHPQIFFIDPNDLDAVSQSASTGQKLELTPFLEKCKIACVTDVAAPDQKNRTWVMEKAGIMEPQAFTHLDETIQLLLKEKDNRLVTTPIGCGDFGNTLEDFCGAIYKNRDVFMQQRASVSLVAREDNAATLIQYFYQNPIVINQRPVKPALTISLKNISRIWDKAYARLDPADENSIAAMRVFNDAVVRIYQKEYPDNFAEHIKQFRDKKLNQHKSAPKENKKIIQSLGELSEENYFLQKSLLTLVQSTLDFYDSQTGVKGAMTNAIHGENICLTVLRTIHNGNIDSDKALVEAFMTIERLIQDKKNRFPALPSPSLLDKTFIQLENNFRIVQDQWQQSAVLKEMAKLQKPVIVPKKSRVPIPVPGAKPVKALDNQPEHNLPKTRGSLEKQDFLQQKAYLKQGKLIEESPQLQAKRVFWELMQRIKQNPHIEIRLLYAANNKQSEAIHKANVSTDKTWPAMLEGAHGQGAFFRELLLLMNRAIEAGSLSKKNIQINPVTTSLHGGSDKNNNIVSKNMLDRDLRAIERSVKAGAHVYGIPDAKGGYSIGGGISTWFYNQEEAAIEGMSQGQYAQKQLQAIERQESLGLQNGSLQLASFLTPLANETAKEQAMRVWGPLLSYLSTGKKIGLLYSATNVQSISFRKAYENGTDLPNLQGSGQTAFYQELITLINGAVALEMIPRDMVRIFPISTTNGSSVDKFSFFSNDCSTLEMVKNDLEFIEENLANGWKILGIPTSDAQYAIGSLQNSKNFMQDKVASVGTSLHEVTQKTLKTLERQYPAEIDQGVKLDQSPLIL